MNLRTQEQYIRTIGRSKKQEESTEHISCCMEKICDLLVEISNKLDNLTVIQNSNLGNISTSSVISKIDEPVFIPEIDTSDMKSNISELDTVTKTRDLETILTKISDIKNDIKDT